MHGPTRIFWVNLTPFSLKGSLAAWQRGPSRTGGAEAIGVCEGGAVQQQRLPRNEKGGQLAQQM